VGAQMQVQRLTQEGKEQHRGGVWSAVTALESLSDGVRSSVWLVNVTEENVARESVSHYDLKRRRPSFG
jgi:hypothetical protein